MKAIKIFFCIIIVAFLIVGVPIIINGCYKANCGYITVWSGADVLGYYGAILGSTIAVVTLVITIIFTKKQIQRESFLTNETEKWDKLKGIFLQMLSDINPMRVLKNVMDNGVADPAKAINLLQRYQLDCKMTTDVLNAHLNMVDYPKLKGLIDNIYTAAQKFDSVCQKEIEQYSNLQFLKHKDKAYMLLKTEKEHPGFLSQDDIAFNKEIIDKCQSINYENINQNIAQINAEFIQLYEDNYKALLQLTGATFEMISIETQKHADNMLSFSHKRQRMSPSSKEVEKSNENNQ